MGFGIGTSGDRSFDLVEGSDSWGGPQNGVDIQGQLNVPSVSTRFGGSLSVDTYLFLIIMGALALLWLFGGVLFKNARM